MIKNYEVLSDTVEKKVKKLSEMSPQILEKMIKSESNIGKDLWIERKGEKVFYLTDFIY